MDLKKPNIIYFLGIGGIGMSALARYLKQQGNSIIGYDLTSTPLTQNLEKEDIIVHYDLDDKYVTNDIDFAIYTPAISSTHKLLNTIRNKNIPLFKRSEIIGKILEDQFTIAIAGTHGKTSISALTAYILKSAGKNVCAFVGGILKDYGTNLVISAQNEVFIIEADEYDRSFLQLNPDIGLISAMDPDHLDIYNNADNMIRGFQEFAGKLKNDGVLIVNEKLSEQFPESLTYGFTSEADIQAKNAHISNGRFVFDMTYRTRQLDRIKMTIPGEHYIENALASSGIAFALGLNDVQVQSALETFKGVERRFEVRVNQEKQVYIDDYAHHPAEINATLKAVRALYPSRKITGIFQPHLYSRTRDFADEFAQSLEILDEIMLLPIYPAREKPINGVSSALIFEKIKNTNKYLVSKEEMIERISIIETEVLITLGAGDVGIMADIIEQKIVNR